MLTDGKNMVRSACAHARTCAVSPLVGLDV